MSHDKDERELVATVDHYIVGSFNGNFTPEDREEIRQEAFVGLQLQRAREPVEDAEAVVIACARNAARMRLRSADRRRHHPFDPHDSAEARIPDAGAGPDELVVRADEDRRVRVLIEELSEQQRAALKLRLDGDLEAREIAGRLGLSISHAHRLLKQAGRALVAVIAASELGAFSRRQRSLLAAVVMGVASERQRRAAECLLEDPHARAILAELRGLGQKTAAALPLPPTVAAEQSGGRLSELAAHVKDQLADAAGVTKQHAAAVYVRAGDPTPLAGARPGAVAATVASCLALGGGAYCAVDGLPKQLGAPLGLERQAQADSEAKAKAPEPPKTPIAPATPTPAEPPPAAPKPNPPAPAAPPPAPPPPAPPPPAPVASPSQQEFGIEQPSAPAPAPAPPPPSGGGSGGGGGTSQFGIER